MSLEVTVIPRGVAMGLDKVEEHCRSCGVLLKSQNASEWSRQRGLCTNCVRTIVGARLDDPVATFLIGGYFMFCKYTTHGEDNWRIRVEIRSKSQVDMIAVKRMLGGRVYLHGGTTWRWSASGLEDIHRIGQFLIQYQPELGMVLTGYTTQPNRAGRSAFAEAVLIRFGKRTIRILEYVDTDGQSGGLGELSPAEDSSPGATVAEKEATTMPPKGTPPDIPEDNGGSSETEDEPATDIVPPSFPPSDSDNGDESPSDGYWP